MAAGCLSGPAYTPGIYVVQPRDTLYSIAWRHDLDYRELARWNHIGADYRITVGQVLQLTPVSRSRAARPVPPGEVSGSDAARPLDARRPGDTARAGETASPGEPCGYVAAGTPVPAGAARAPGYREPPGVQQRWIWPTAHPSTPRPVPGGGILLLGALGQPIRAACAGRVVYAGNGLRGYGNLIIIKHDEAVLSAYAHTEDLAVHEGQEVATGEQIARMGTGPHDIAALYFEIRLNGKPVDPLPFLPGGH